METRFYVDDSRLHQLPFVGNQIIVSLQVQKHLYDFDNW